MALAGCSGLELIFAYYISIPISIPKDLCDPGTHPMYLSHTLISGQFYCVLNTTFYPPRMITWQF